MVSHRLQVDPSACIAATITSGDPYQHLFVRDKGGCAISPLKGFNKKVTSAWCSCADEPSP